MGCEHGGFCGCAGRRGAAAGMADRARASIRAAAAPVARPAPVAAAAAPAPAYVPTDTPVLPESPAWLRAFCGTEGGDFYTAPSVVSWAGRRFWVATDGHRLAMVLAPADAPVNVEASRLVGGLMSGLRQAGEPRAYTVTSEVVYQWGRLRRGEQNEPQMARIDGPAGPVVLDRRLLNGACLSLADDSGAWEWRVRGPADPVSGKGPDGRILVIMPTAVRGEDPMGLPALTTAGVTSAPVAIVTVPAADPEMPPAAPELPPAAPRRTPAPGDMVPAPGPVRAEDKRTVPCPCPLCRKALPAARNLRAASLGENRRAAA